MHACIMSNFFLSFQYEPYSTSNILQKCPLDVYKTILKCWEANPLDRPTFAELNRLLYDPSTEVVDQPLYENTDGYVQYVNLQYENMQDVQRT